MKFKEKKIAFIIGTRAELIKTFPLMLELKRMGREYLFIHTGQHFLGDLCNLFSIRQPDIILSKEPRASSKFNVRRVKAIFWNIWIIFRIRKILRKCQGLDYVIYHGDTMTTASAAIASSKLLNPFKKYKNVHLEGGLRSKNLLEPFPEEISRKVADYFSDIILAVSEKSCRNVQHYKKKIVYLTGNSIVDSVDYSLKLAKKIKTEPLASNPFCLISIHRHENLKNKNRLRNIVEILSSLEIESYFMVHDNTLKQLRKFNLVEELEKNKKLTLTKPIDYVRFIYQMSRCSLVICDGGSIQEESLILKKPCIILRKFTERQEGLETNFQFLSNLNVKKAKEKIKEFLSKDFKIKEFDNPYGKKGVSRGIAKILK